MKITDGTRTVDLTMELDNGVDWVVDFIGTDCFWNEETEIGEVNSVNDCIESAVDWLKEANNEECDVEVVENDVKTRYIIENGELVKLVF